MIRKSIFSYAVSACIFVSLTSAAPVIHDKIVPKLSNRLIAAEPSEVRIDGWLGKRIDQNITDRLLVVESEPLLAGFKRKPGSHPWIGEHVGKWLHAATLAWDYTQDKKLREKLDQVAAELIAAQEPDGYLGTYAPEKRFGLYPQAEWDVWSHKYCLIGLLTYYRYTGNAAALSASQKAADLLLRTFPEKKSILKAGTHEGMAATSVLEPIVDLYRITGDARYLDFAHYLVRSYDEPGGPAIVRTLLSAKQVNRVGNRKAYEMLSNLVGLLELARTTGDKELLAAVTNAWADVVKNRLYLTGTASTFELFPDDHELYNGVESHIGETCVTTTWIQLSRGLLLLTGDDQYAAEIERSLYNHLTAAQRPSGGDWCYYTPLEGKKPYDKDITCCHSSGPRALALAPTVAFLSGEGAVYVDTLESSRAKLTINGHQVEIALKSSFPREGRATLTVKTSEPVEFAVRVRVPAWSALHLGEQSAESGWLEVSQKKWSGSESLPVTFALEAKVVKGEFTNYGRVAYTWGPFVLAVDRAANPKAQPLPSLRAMTDREVKLIPGETLRFGGWVWGQWINQPREVTYSLFADAGGTDEEFRVWLRSY